MDRFEFGEFEISRIEEIVDRVDASFMIPSLTTEILTSTK
jgi:hypothetical protein